MMAIGLLELPVRHFTLRARLYIAWFDKECRDAKRLSRTLQRRYYSRFRHSDSSEIWRVTPAIPPAMNLPPVAA